MSLRKLQRATIDDVARMAGVSISTVSRVLNGTAPVAAETLERVRHAVEVLHFAPQAAARTLAGRKSNAIGLLLPEIGSGFFAPMLRGIEQAVREAGMDLLILAGSAAGPERRPDSRLLGAHNTDGLLVFATQMDDRALAGLHQRGLPVVLLHRRAPPGVPMPSVRFDNAAGVHALLRHLIGAHGRRRIAFLRGPAGNDDSVEREAAYRARLAADGLAADPALVLDGGYSEKGGEAAVERLLADGTPFDALFAGDDETAAGVLAALRRAGRRVPEEVAVVGFDDVPPARHLNPPLTTVRAPIEAAGYIAAQQLVRLLGGEEAAAETVLPVELVIRCSCGCAPSAA